jgi:rhodanese-related sulfurtransferase
MAWNVPLMAQTYEWDPGKQYFKMQLNTDFVEQVMAFAEPTDTILVMCRSGGRSAMAVDQLARAGFTNVFNITDGMEGDEVNNSASVYHGHRLVNGWKNSGLPWTYQPNPGLMHFITTETEK